MDNLTLMRQLHRSAETKIVMLVIDGVGGLPREPGGPTELEAAHKPNLDALAAEAMCGLSTAVFPGVTPGSGPSHLSLFGYDPLRYDIGRGVLEALGIGFDLQSNDIAARGNFCTMDAEGNIVDRRAGRIPTEKGAQLCALLRHIRLPGVRVFVEPVKEYRFVLVLRGEGLQDGLTETDPQRTGVPPMPVEAERPEAQPTADLFNRWLAEARHILADHHPANGCNLRGLAKDPGLPQMQDVYGLKPAAIATYPMYKGVSKLIGMDALDAGETLETEVEALQKGWADYDFFYFHIKKTDSAGEDGDFDRKVGIIEHTDRVVVPAIRALNPDVIIVSGDHSTPSVMKVHSWHPLPVIFWSHLVRRDTVTTFGETFCSTGALGHVHHTDLMPLALGHAGRLAKYGA